LPLVVIGDFNADPRDPRGLTEPNPGLQPDTTTGCAAQVTNLSVASADASCNAYWTMVKAGFADAGPNSLDPTNATWGASALLAGPDLTRLAQAPDNAFGYTDRLDYVFTANGAQATSATLVGDRWPDGPDVWSCDAPDQTTNAKAAAEAMGVPLGDVVCLPTDHVGLLVTVDVPVGDTDDHSPSAPGPPAGVWIGIVAALLVGSGLVSLWAVLRSRGLGI